jgi:uncharacterized membrane protein YdbT with pleckstrin-like domain
MSYYRQVLRPGEAVQFIAHVHWCVYSRAFSLLSAGAAIAGMGGVIGAGHGAPIVFLAVFGIALILAGTGLVAALRAGVRRMTTEIVVTDLRVIFKRGLISRHTVEMNTSKIETVDVEQTLLGRVLGYGTVLIHGTGASFEPLCNVARPINLRNAILVG